MQTDRNQTGEEDRQTGRQAPVPENLWPLLSGGDETGIIPIEWVLDWINHKERSTS